MAKRLYCYGVYDVTDSDVCCLIGNAEEVAEFVGYKNPHALRHAADCQCTVNKRYRIEKIREEDIYVAPNM